MVALLSYTFSWAQYTDIQQAMKKYKKVNTMTASVVRTKHNVALYNDVVTNGKLFFKQPSHVSMIFNGGKDKLLMNGSNFVMVNNSRQSVAKGKTQSQFDAFIMVFRNVFLGENCDIKGIADTKVTRKGNMCTLTVTPVVDGGKKTQKRLMFTSFSLVIDLKSAEFKSLRMNERGGNYTQYDFSGYTFGGNVDDKCFKP